ncbi:poly-gamma-glutamate synthase PgsB/CapB [Kibdelosporangium banguiense]|uniref:Poly-gamma-glutamate synthase PgsB/CapB n=1 Tax=Kibdelosporangium banguiense TaxID=1365924 RepID=A0ABS4THC1_9PSEU|nr:poly-gamma-glutamate synthase PgsB [Kibdelosporangium banguiense]MBP2323394.1 poly-gamma-glutamate synthase PgsB/CapB [Kibdelosporangium banguiense]
MLFLFVVFTTACLSLLVLGVVEQRRHYANLRRIPTRVLVNGIRGKSSITRLCAGALRGGGLVTVAKTTGTAARFIHPDGSEEPVYRKFGIANVVEQIGIVRRASAYRPDVLTIECMAVQPDLQEINQRKLIQSTIGVLCNVREDHLAEMGPTLDDVARSLSRSMPVGGICVTAEQERLHILQQEAKRRDCKLIAVEPESVTDEQMAGFSWITFKENVAIALAVADLLGVNRQSALAGMWDAAPDPGVLSVQRYQAGSLHLRFANIFAANDPESTLMNIEQLLGNKAIERPLHVVINCRPDRIERNGQMGALIPRIDPVRVVLIGEQTRSARAAIPTSWQGEVVDLGGRQDPGKLLAGVLNAMAGTASLVTIGNIHGQGEVLLEQLATLQPADPQQPSAGPSLPPEPQPTSGFLPPTEPWPGPSAQAQPTGFHSPVESWPGAELLQSVEPGTVARVQPAGRRLSSEYWFVTGSQPVEPEAVKPKPANGSRPSPVPRRSSAVQRTIPLPRRVAPPGEGGVPDPGSGS